jgi:hypothetical protein
MGDFVMAEEKTKSSEHRIKDRDAKSRTVEDKRINAPVAPDVEVNDPRKIMGDEGPVAEANPHNKPDEAA